MEYVIVFVVILALFFGAWAALLHVAKILSAWGG